MAATIDNDIEETTGHAILRCKVCKSTGRRSYTLITTRFAYNGRPASTQEARINGHRYSVRDRYELDQLLHSPCPICGSNEVKVNRVRGIYVADKTCNSKCMAAIGPSCECSCAGENHGGRIGGWN